MPTRHPRLNVTLTDEQHALLLELAELQGRSASSYLREMLDAATPLLRATVPALRLAAKEMESKREEVHSVLAPMMDQLRSLGMVPQADMLDELQPQATARPGASRSERSERGRAKSAGSAAR